MSTKADSSGLVRSIRTNGSGLFVLQNLKCYGGMRAIVFNLDLHSCRIMCHSPSQVVFMLHQNDACSSISFTRSSVSLTWESVPVAICQQWARFSHSAILEQISSRSRKPIFSRNCWLIEEPQSWVVWVRNVRGCFREGFKSQSRWGPRWRQCWPSQKMMTWAWPTLR